MIDVAEEIQKVRYIWNFFRFKELGEHFSLTNDIFPTFKFTFIGGVVSPTTPTREKCVFCVRQPTGGAGGMTTIPAHGRNFARLHQNSFHHS